MLNKLKEWFHKKFDDKRFSVFHMYSGVLHVYIKRNNTLPGYQFRLYWPKSTFSVCEIDPTTYVMFNTKDKTAKLRRKRAIAAFNNENMEIPKEVLLHKK